ncbi:MAG: hypothetical protein KDB14_25355 [Planctomycetales bacterium]|nr:hypothetical protein [Planctomycetales bacterium]
MGVLLTCCVSGELQASCGDYVTIGASRHSAAAVTHASDMPVLVAPLESPQRSRCHGPQCSAPVPAPWSPGRAAAPPTKQELPVALPGCCSGELTRRAVTDLTVTVRAGYPAILERPPRRAG